MGKDAEDPEVAAMMAQMGQSMPTFPTHVSQCDLKQDLFINEKNRAYFIDYYDWSSLPPEKLKRRPNQKMVIKGTVTTDMYFTDSGRRQQMFGLPARWLKVTKRSSNPPTLATEHVDEDRTGRMVRHTFARKRIVSDPTSVRKWWMQTKDHHKTRAKSGHYDHRNDADV